MNCRLYVGNLEWSIDNIFLQNVFNRVGRVKTSIVILDRDTGRSRGFGFVEMATEEEARKAIEELNGTPLNGRDILVHEAKPEGIKMQQDFENMIDDFTANAYIHDKTDFTIGEKHFVLIRDR